MWSAQATAASRSVLLFGDCLIFVGLAPSTDHWRLLTGFRPGPAAPSIRQELALPRAAPNDQEVLDRGLQPAAWLPAQSYERVFPQHRIAVGRNGRTLNCKTTPACSSLMISNSPRSAPRHRCASCVPFHSSQLEFVRFASPSRRRGSCPRVTGLGSWTSGAAGCPRSPRGTLRRQSPMHGGDSEDRRCGDVDAHLVSTTMARRCQPPWVAARRAWVPDPPASPETWTHPVARGRFFACAY
jgi:hypothetical protein